MARKCNPFFFHDCLLAVIVSLFVIAELNVSQSSFLTTSSVNSLSTVTNEPRVP